MINRRTLEWVVFGIIIWLVAEVLSLKKQLRVRRAEGFATGGSADLESIREMNEFARKMISDGVVAGNLKVTGNLQVDGEVNSNKWGTFGPAYVGPYHRENYDAAEYSHKDRSSNSGLYTFLSHKDGTTYINSGNGKAIILRHNNDGWPTNNGHGMVYFDTNISPQRGVYNREGIGAYMIDTGNTSLPLLAGRHRMNDTVGRADKEDWYLIMPGWHLKAWDGGDWNNHVRCDYHNKGIGPVRVNSGDDNTVASYELTYRGP